MPLCGHGLLQPCSVPRTDQEDTGTLASQGLLGKGGEVQGLSRQRPQETEGPWDESDLVLEKQHNPPQRSPPFPISPFSSPFLVR